MTYGLEFFGRYYGSYRGFVANNEDPLGMNRLQLVIPILNPTAVDETWAFPQNVWGGKNYGAQVLPQVGDMVWVEFEMGDPDYPIWKHAGYAEGEKPEEFETTNHYGFKTPKGTILLINDNKEQEEVLVKLNSQEEWVKIIKEELEVEAKLIKLGANGDEQAVMGDTLKEKMDTLMDRIEDLNDAFIKHKHAGSSQPPTPDDIAVVEAIQVKLDNLKDEFPEYLSEKVKIDK